MLVKSVKKDITWLVFHLENDKEIKILVKNKPGSKKQAVALIDCPKEIKITSFEEEKS